MELLVLTHPTQGRRQAPRPEDSAAGPTVLRHRVDRDYVVVQNAVARDARLSYRARGVLLDMISRPPNWRFNAERLAACSPNEGRDAVRTAIGELRKAGYVLYTRERSGGGRWRTVVTVSDKPLRAWADVAAAGVVPDSTQRPKRADVASAQVAPETDRPASESQASKEVPANEEQIDLDKTGLPLASLAADTPPSNFDPGKRSRDRALFADLLGGDTVVCDGRPWTKGRHTIGAFYNGLRTSRKITLPGLYLARIAENGGGIDDWLIDEGVTVDGRDPWA